MLRREIHVVPSSWRVMSDTRLTRRQQAERGAVARGPVVLRARPSQPAGAGRQEIRASRMSPKCRSIGVPNTPTATSCMNWYLRSLSWYEGLATRVHQSAAPAGRRWRPGPDVGPDGPVGQRLASESTMIASVALGPLCRARCAGNLATAHSRKRRVLSAGGAASPPPRARSTAHAFEPAALNVRAFCDVRG